MYYTLYNPDNFQQARVASLTAVAALLSDLWILIAIVYISIAIDFYLGYSLSRKVKRENPASITSGKLESAKWWHTIIKARDASLVIGVLYLFDLFIIRSGNFYLSRLGAGFIIGAELLSMIENLAYLYRWARFFRKYVKNKIEKHVNINIDEIL
ncbi:MAG: phage holin family protein [Odoribacteraceae bacterium]|jgi:hypothetical protein|nr:phage holin family protein [Odoribacteraceae bacterium]